MNLRFQIGIPFAIAVVALGCTAILGDFDVASTAIGDSGVPDVINLGDGSSTVDADSSADSGSGHFGDVASVSVGARHSCALTNSGDVYCWGDNSQGQIGLPLVTTPRSPHPVKIDALPGKVTSLVAGEFHTCAIVGADLYCWGQNACGQVGAGDVITPSRQPRKVVAPSGGDVQWIAVAPGRDHTCAIESGGATYCWGCNAANQGGTIGANPISKPANAGNDKLNGAAISASTTRTCMRGNQPAVRCWGTEAKGEFGNGGPSTDSSTLASAALLGAAPVALTTGEAHTCVLDADRNVVCWGDNSFGQLGFDADGGLSTSPATSSPASNQKAKAVSAGGLFTCVIGADGVVGCFGSNQSGELGRGGAVDNGVHIAIDSVSRPGVGNIALHATSISAGRGHACAVLELTNEVVCWGAGEDGQIGDGTVGGTARSSPVFVLPP